MRKTMTFRARNNRDVVVDARLWQAACQRTSAEGGGRLGAADAAALFAILAEDGRYSALEKKTIRHIRHHFRWTPKGNVTFRRLVRDAAQHGWSGDEFETCTQPDQSGRSVTLSVALWTEALIRTIGQGDGRLGVDDAEALFALVTADGEYSALEKKTIRHIRRHFRWTDSGDATFRKNIRATAHQRGWTDAEFQEIWPEND